MIAISYGGSVVWSTRCTETGWAPGWAPGSCLGDDVAALASGGSCRNASQLPPFMSRATSGRTNARTRGQKDGRSAWTPSALVWKCNIDERCEWVAIHVVCFSSSSLVCLSTFDAKHDYIDRHWQPVTAPSSEPCARCAAFKGRQKLPKTCLATATHNSGATDRRTPSHADRVGYRHAA